jgi:hypothetical protein
MKSLLILSLSTQSAEIRRRQGQTLWWDILGRRRALRCGIGRKPHWPGNSKTKRVRPGPIGQVESIKRKKRAMDVPSCSKSAKGIGAIGSHRSAERADEIAKAPEITDVSGLSKHISTGVTEVSVSQLRGIPGQKLIVSVRVTGGYMEGG